jgi:hypothetical protein
MNGGGASPLLELEYAQPFVHVSLGFVTVFSALSPRLCLLDACLLGYVFSALSSRRLSSRLLSSLFDSLLLFDPILTLILILVLILTLTLTLTLILTLTFNPKPLTLNPNRNPSS